MLFHLSLLTLATAVVQYDFTIENSALTSRNAHHSIHRRSLNSSTSNNTVEPVINASLTTSYNFYYGSVYLGTPPQKIDVLLDTGSPITWVYGPQGTYEDAPMFYSNESSTFELGNQSFSAEYGSGEYLGHWGTDIISAPQFIQGLVLKNTNGSVQNSSYGVPFEFGTVSTFATSAGAPGLLGLGPHIDYAGPSTYLSLPEAYAKNNVTSSSAFSVFLEDHQGRFLFGGVDTKYFDFPLYRFHPKTALSGSPSNGGPGASDGSTSWEIFLDGVTLNNGTDYIVRSNVVLDTGSPVSLLPPGFVDAVGNALGLTKYGKYETFYVNRTATPQLPTGTISFDFNGFEITGDLSNFLVPGEYIWLDDGPQNVTALALMGSPNYLLGDAFFRSAYAILDPATKDVILGQRSNILINSTTNATNASSIVPFSALLHNSTAIRNGSDLRPSNPEGAGPAVTTSVVQIIRTVEVTSTPLVIGANHYIGTVPADKAASLTGSLSSSFTSTDTRASAKSSSSPSSSFSSSSSSSSKRASNAGSVVKPGSKLWLSIIALTLIYSH